MDGFEKIIKRIDMLRSELDSFEDVVEKLSYRSAAIPTLAEWNRFKTALDNINTRDSLVAQVIVLSGLRISEVLDIKVDQVDFEKNCMTLYVGSSRVKKKTVVKLCPLVMRDLKRYFESTGVQRHDSKYLFVTSSGRRVTRSRMNYSFRMASEECGLYTTPDKLKELADIVKLEERRKLDEFSAKE